VFDAFHRSAGDLRYRYGLGLYFARQLIEGGRRHRVESVAGDPRCHGRVSPSSFPRLYRGDGGGILLVDDDPR
jgi:hypothetical protein